MNTLSKKRVFLLIVVLLLVISFVLTHWAADFLYFISWARRVHESDVNGIAALSSVWEIKGILLRSIYLGMYNFSLLFFDDLSLAFQSTFKLLAGFFLFVLISSGSFLLPLQKQKFDRFAIFITASISLFATHYAVHMEGEFFAVGILFLSTCLYLRGKLFYKYISGLLLGALFFIKTPLPIMGGSLFFIAILYKDTSFLKELKSVIPTVVSMLLSIVAVLGVLFVISPQEITDILDARIIQHTIFSTTSDIAHKLFYEFPLGLFRSAWFFPVFAVSLMIIFKKLRNLSKKHILCLLGTFLFPTIYVVLSNCYYVYHYFVYAYPAIFIVGGMLGRTNSIEWSRILISLCVSLALFFGLFNVLHTIPSSTRLWALISLLLVCGWFFTNSKWYEYIFYTIVFFVFLSNDICLSPSTLKSNEEYRDYLSNATILNQPIGGYLGAPSERVLFLDCAISSFYIKNPSYSRYFYPQIIQRTDENSSKIFIREYLRTYNKKSLITKVSILFRMIGFLHTNIQIFNHFY